MDKNDPIKLLEAIRDAYYKTDLGINNTDNEILTTKNPKRGTSRKATGRFIGQSC